MTREDTYTRGVYTSTESTDPTNRDGSRRATFLVEIAGRRGVIRDYLQWLSHALKSFREIPNTNKKRRQMSGGRGSLPMDGRGDA